MSKAVESKASPKATRQNKFLNARNIPLLAAICVCLLLYVVASVRYNNFCTPRIFVNFLVDNSFLGIVAIGMTMVIITGGIDLSVGGVVALCSVVMAKLMASCGVSPLVAWLAAIAIGTTMGLLTGCAVRYFKIEPFIATLAGLFLARGMALIISTEAISINNKFILDLNAVGIPLGNGLSLPLPAIIFLVTIAVGVYVTLFTPFGRNLFAVGGNEDAAHLMGLPVGRTKMLVYVLSGLFASIAAIVFTIYQPSGDPIGANGMELDAIAISVIGGTLLTGGAGNILGTAVGVLIFGILQTSVTMENLNSYWTRVVIGLLLLTFVVLQRFVTAGARGKGK